jgi:predicted DNA-binding protein (MmcQ/YjbR family)
VSKISIDGYGAAPTQDLHHPLGVTICSVLSEGRGTSWARCDPCLFEEARVNVPQLKRFCRGFPGATEILYGEPYNFLVYSVGGKKFAYFKTSHPERWRFSTRVSPDRFIELTDVPGVKPARYRGRFHWITIVNVSSFPVLYLTELVEWSYNKALASLTKARQIRIRASG